MATSDTIIRLLREGQQPARALYERLGVSQPTLSRMVAQLGESILRFGKARQTQYALRRKVGSHDKFPLFRVSELGNLEQWGILHPVMPAAYLVEILPNNADGPRMDFHHGLPWYLQDMRPQGFLGRAFARYHGPMLGLPTDPNRWSDDQSLLALAHFGLDCPGNLLVGEEAASVYQTGALFSTAGGNLLSVPAEQRMHKYPEFARMALAGEIVGLSAGGEQPKFNIEVLCDGQSVHVMVKFTAPQDNAATRRWRSLLICEHLAFQVLRGWMPTSHSQLLNVETGGFADQLFLEVPRFDRIGNRGRCSVVSLKALDDEFTGLAADWPRVAAALVQAGKLGESVYEQVQKLYVFGVLIGNGDMHPGNLSFFVDEVTNPAPELADMAQASPPNMKALAPVGSLIPTFPQQPNRCATFTLTLAPVYDMLPMSLAPKPSGQIPGALPMPKVGINPPLEIWRAMLPLSCDYWRQVAAHSGVADDVRQIAHNQAEILSRLLNLTVPI